MDLKPWKLFLEFTLLFASQIIDWKWQTNGLFTWHKSITVICLQQFSPWIKYISKHISLSYAQEKFKQNKA